MRGFNQSVGDSAAAEVTVILSSTCDEAALGQLTSDRHPEDVAQFRREMAALRRRLRASSKKTKQLSSDTAFLLREAASLTPPKIISCNDADWEKKLYQIEIGPEGVFITDVATVEAIRFISAFAAKRQLLLAYSQGSFRLTPRSH